MPLYSYVCGKCGETSELLMRSDEAPVCPACDSRDMERLPSWLAPNLKSDAARKSWRAAAARGGDLSNFSTSERNSFKK